MKIIVVPRSGLAPLVAILAVVATPHPVAAQQPTVGIYSDVAGSNCTLADVSPGILEAYVVVRPGSNSVSGAQFAAPLPGCFSGAYIGDQTVPGTLVLGHSQTGVSVVLLTCTSNPVHVLTIQYFGNGSTPACCAYDVVPDPVVGAIEVVDCAFQTLAGVGVTSRFNADATCACAGNTPPSAPQFPDPADGAASVSPLQTLSWQASDVDGNIAGYDVYLGTDPVPPLAAAGLAAPAYDPGPLTELATHYWRVVVHDLGGLETSGPVWTFTTRALNTPPTVPAYLFPGNASTGQRLDLELRWTSTDFDQDPIVFDVYFGDSPSPPLVFPDYPWTTYFPGPLDGNVTYYWRIVARDSKGAESPGPTWSFTTRSNVPPVITSLFPPDGTLDVARNIYLGWVATEPDGDDFVIDLYFGTASPPPLLSSNIPSSVDWHELSGLEFLTQFYWRIVARDEFGATTSSPVSTFTTRANTPPSVPAVPNPTNGAVDVSMANLSLRWACSDVDQQVVTYDVYFGTVSPPPLAATDVPERTFKPEGLVKSTQYFWRILARDELGLETSGPVWAFTTTNSTPPSAPTNPAPPNLGVAGLTPTLSWTASDVDGDGLRYSVLFGTSSPPPFVTQVFSPSYAPGLLQSGMVYYWQIYVSDGRYLTLGPVWSFTAIGGPVPVLFTRFVADATEAGVNVRWELSGDETAEQFTLLRRTGAEAAAVKVGEGAVSGTTGSLLDATVEPATTYHYQLVVRTPEGNQFQSPVATVTTTTVALTLGQNHPNPFNPQTSIPYILPNGSMRVRLLIMDVSGRLVRTLVDEPQTRGAHEAIWDGRDDRAEAVSSGVYFYVLDVETRRLTKKLVLLK